MSKTVSETKPAPPTAGGPYFVVTKVDNAVQRVTLGLANVPAALTQMKTDQQDFVPGTVDSIRVETTSHS